MLFIILRVPRFVSAPFLSVVLRVNSLGDFLRRFLSMVLRLTLYDVIETVFLFGLLID